MTISVLKMFNNIKNTQKSKKQKIKFYRNKVCENYLKLLWDEGFIDGYKIINLEKKKIEVFLKYSNTGIPIINSVKFISKPGFKMYFSIKQIWKLDSTKAFFIFSTSKGLMSIKNCKKNRIGGELVVVIN